MSTSVSGLSGNFFPSPQNGFTTTLGSSISAGATTVPLNSVAGFTNGQIAVLVVDPNNSSKQTFTGVVDTVGVQLTSVIWTAGTNVSHLSGATVVDYATATHPAMISKGIQIAHNQDGTHKSGAVYALPTITDFSNATHGHTSTATGGSLGANSVGTTQITAANVTDAKLKYGKVRTRQGGSATDWSTAGTTTFDTSALDTFIQCGVVTASGSLTITFPTAFTQPPVVVCTPTNFGGTTPSWYITTVTATNFVFVTNANVSTINWTAIGN